MSTNVQREAQIPRARAWRVCFRLCEVAFGGRHKRVGPLVKARQLELPYRVSRGNYGLATRVYLHASARDWGATKRIEDTAGDSDGLDGRKL